MAALNSPFQSPFTVPVGALAKPETPAARALSLASQDPNWPQFLALGKSKYPSFDDAALANLFLRPAAQAILSQSPEPPPKPTARPPENMDAADAQMRQYDQANSLPFAQGTVPLGAGYKNYVGGILEADRTQGVQGALAEVVVGGDNTQEGPYFAEQPTDMYQNPNANNDALAINSYQKPTTPYFANQTPEMYAPPPAPPPALNTADANNNSTTTTTSSGGALSSASNGGSGGRNTGNSRGSNLPNMKMSNGEKWIRMGMAGLANSANGPMAQMAAIGGAYTDVQADNRAADAEVFAIEEARRTAEIKARAAGAKGSGSGGDGPSAQSVMLKLQTANEVLAGFDSHDGVTGWNQWFTRGWDNLTGESDRQNIRLKIASMKVDRTLARVAETKGAISEKEMEIFMSDQPSWYAHENIWRKWVKDYVDAMHVMHTNLANGTTVNGGSAGGNQETTEDLVKKYS